MHLCSLCAGSLPHLSSLSLTDNPLTSPPQHVVRQGTRAVLAYLRLRWEEDNKGNTGGSWGRERAGVKNELC